MNRKYCGIIEKINHRQLVIFTTYKHVVLCYTIMHYN